MTAIALPVSGITLDEPGNLKKATGGATISSGAGVGPDSSDSGEIKAISVNSSTTITPQGFLYQDTADGGGAYIAINGALIGGFVGLTANTMYAFDTGGTLTDDPNTDLSSGEKLIWAGYATSTTQLRVHIIDTGETI